MCTFWVVLSYGGCGFLFFLSLSPFPFWSLRSKEWELGVFEPVWMGQGLLHWEGGKSSFPWIISAFFQSLHDKVLKIFFSCSIIRREDTTQHPGWSFCYSVLELKSCGSTCTKITYFFISYFKLFSVVVNKFNFWNALFLTGISMVFNFLMTLSQRTNWVLYIKYLVKYLLT